MESAEPANHVLYTLQVPVIIDQQHTSSQLGRPLSDVRFHVANGSRLFASTLISFGLQLGARVDVGDMTYDLTDEPEPRSRDAQLRTVVFLADDRCVAAGTVALVRWLLSLARARALSLSLSRSLSPCRCALSHLPTLHSPLERSLQGQASDFGQPLDQEFSRLRKTEEYADVPIILVTSPAFAAQMRRGASSGRAARACGHVCARAHRTA